MIITIVALAVAILIPAAVGFFIFKRNKYKTGSYGLMVIAFGAGVGSYVIAAMINSQLLVNTGLIGVTQLAKFITPWEEEILKAIFFLFILRRVENLSQFIDWAIYGFVIGIGFAIAENFEYVTAYQDVAFSVAISRVISTNLMHASATALAGTAFGYSRSKSGIKKILFILSGLGLGILIHFGFNFLVNSVSSSFLLAYAAGVGILSTGLIILIIRRGLKEAKNSIKEKLTMADRVTGQESRLVQEYGKANTLLDPLEEMFGKRVGQKVHEFLQLQARIGIHRKNQDQFTGSKLVETTESTANAQREKMDQIRKELGPYVMLMVRNIFPESDRQLMDTLESTIEQRMKAPAHKRGGLFDSLDGKLKK